MVGGVRREEEKKITHKSDWSYSPRCLLGTMSETVSSENLMPVASSIVEAPPSTADVQAQDVVPAPVVPVTVEDPSVKPTSTTPAMAEDDSIKVEKLVVVEPSAKEAPAPKRRLDLVCVLRECDRDEQDDTYAECLGDIMEALQRKLKKKREASKKKE